MLPIREARSSPTLSASRFAPAWQALTGALLCWFIWRELGFIDLFPLWRGATGTIFGAALVGWALSFTRARALLYGVVAASVILWLMVAFTPLAAFCTRSLRVEQTPVRADAIVVLLASIQADNDFGTPSLERTLHGVALMRQKYAPRLILTQGVPPQGSHRIAALNLLQDLRIQCSVEVVGPVGDTHDEAVAVSRLARQKGWKRILLVTSPVHSRRAALVFAKTGLQVISTPCRETSYNWENLATPDERIKAFEAAIHEIIGLRAYRARGWI